MDPVEKVSQLVSKGKTPLVTDPNNGGKFVAILTKIDLLSYLGNRAQ
jgi:predicted transcriptional regulator